MNNFFFIEDESEVTPEAEPVLLTQSFWPFPVVNGERTPESQSLINKGYSHGAQCS